MPFGYSSLTDLSVRVLTGGWCTDYIRRGAPGTAGGPVAARIVKMANWRMCDIHTHKVCDQNLSFVLDFTSLCNV